MKFVFFFLLLLLPFTLIASSTGIIAGSVKDTDGNPLVGATVLIEGTPYGAMTSPQGEYVISALPIGYYIVRVQMVGRVTTTISGVAVEADNLSRIDFELEEDASGSTVITVTQTRTNILRDIPATAFQLDLSEMKTFSTNTVVDMIAAQPGVVQQNGELHVRGGRAGEVDYVLDGISLRSPMNNKFSFDIPTSALSNATLMTGGLSIEYGNTLSGVVDLIGSEGNDEFAGTISGRMGDAVSSITSSGEQVYFESIDTDLCRKDLTKVEISLSGPEPLTQSLFPELGLDIPGEMTISVSGQFSSSGKNNIDTRNNWSYNWINDVSGMIKVTYRPVPRTIYSLNVIGSYRERGWNQWAWSKYEEAKVVDGLLFPPGNQDYALPVLFSETSGLIFNVSHLIGDKTSMKIVLGTVRFQDANRIFSENGGFIGEGENPLFWMTQYSPPVIFESQQGFYYAGVHQNVWYDSKAQVSTAQIGFDINPNPRARLKFGISGKYYDLYQYNAYYLSPGNAYLSLWNAYPFSAAGYAQGSYRFSAGAITTAGIRCDYFNSNTTFFSAEAGEGAPVEAKIHFSPRISFSIPFSERSIFFTTYGHYFQMPPMNSLYLQTTFNMGADRVIAGNPDLSPELTKLFEMGIRQELDTFTNFAVSFYNKDITGLVSTGDNIEGANFVFTNDNSYGNVMGIETSISRSAESGFSGQIFYTFSKAKGRYSSMFELYNNAQFSDVFVSREESYLDWDQTHQAGISCKYTLYESNGPELSGIFPFENMSFLVSYMFGSGTPYSLPPSESQLIETNTERRPSTMQTDLSISRDIRTSIGSIKFVAGVFNLFNRRNVNHIYDTGLFHNSGDPAGELGNPRAWSPARHFLFSAVLSW